MKSSHKIAVFSMALATVASVICIFVYQSQMHRQQRANQIKAQTATFNHALAQHNSAYTRVILGNRGARADVVGQKVIRIEMARIAKESEEAHLSPEARSKRIDAVYIAGEAELKRVHDSHFKHKFDVNFAENL